MKVFIAVLTTMFLVVGCVESNTEVTPIPLPEPVTATLTPVPTATLGPTPVPTHTPVVSATLEPAVSVARKAPATAIPPYLITPQPLLHGNNVSLKVSDYALVARTDTIQTADLYVELELADQSISPNVPFQIIMQIKRGQAEFVTTEDTKHVLYISAKEIVFLNQSYQPLRKLLVTAPVTKLVKGDDIVLTLKLDFAQ